MKMRLKAKKRSAADAPEAQFVGTSPQIIVTGTAEKPYYVIQYREHEDGEIHIGYGSYCLTNVFKWLEEFFGVVHAHAVDPEDLLPRSKWRLNKDGSGTCMRCRRTTIAVWDMDNSLNFCPHCGTDMRWRND